MTPKIISSRYAQSLFDLAIEMNNVEKVSKDMSYIMYVCKDNPILNILMRNPNINIGSKKGIVRDIFKDRLEKLSLDFIILLIEKHRVIFLKEISEEFRNIYNNSKGIKVATLVLVHQIEQELKDRIISIFEQEFNCKIELDEKIDSSIIGGFKVMIEDKVYDASVLNQLSKLRKTFAKNLYEKGF